MEGLSTLARLFRKNAFEQFHEGLEGPRYSPALPAKRGFTRGTLGTMGSTTGGAATRNPDAQVDKDRETIMQLLASKS